MKNNLAEYRIKHGLTQGALAEKSGISRPYISEIETGAQKVISNVVMSKLADALGETVSDFFLPNLLFSHNGAIKKHSKLHKIEKSKLENLICDGLNRSRKNSR